MFKQTLLIGLLFVNACAFATTQTTTQDVQVSNQEAASSFANASADTQEVKQETAVQGNDAQAQVPGEQKPAQTQPAQPTKQTHQQEQPQQQAQTAQAPQQEKELTEAEVEKLIADWIKQAQEEKAAQDAQKNANAQQQETQQK